MGLFDKFLSKSGLTDDAYDYEDAYENEYEDEPPLFEDEDEEAGVTSFRRNGAAGSAPGTAAYGPEGTLPAYEPRHEERSSAVGPAARPGSSTASYVPRARRARRGRFEVCLFRPVTVDDARSICDAVLEGKAAVVILENVRIETAQRITDFLAGACFSIGGRLVPVTENVMVAASPEFEVTDGQL